LWKKPVAEQAAELNLAFGIELGPVPKAAEVRRAVLGIQELLKDAKCLTGNVDGDIGPNTLDGAKAYLAQHPDGMAALKAAGEKGPTHAHTGGPVAAHPAPAAKKTAESDAARGERIDKANAAYEAFNAQLDTSLSALKTNIAAKKPFLQEQVAARLATLRGELADVRASEPDGYSSTVKDQAIAKIAQIEQLANTRLATV
jgi:hypothetical protein